jgi:hypothetical protein
MKYCQNNEEEILDRILKEIGTTNKFAVEFGEHFNHKFSNTEYLKEKGWKVLQFGPEGGDTIDERFTAENVNEIFKKYKVPQKLDFLSIDIDGMDYWVWKSLKYKPRIVCIEYNANKVGIQEYDPKWDYDDTMHFFIYGADKDSLIKLGKEKGYELYDFNEDNLFFYENSTKETRPS